MRCHVCGSNMKELKTDLPFKISESSMVIVKDLPVLQCENCSEYILSDIVMSRVDKILERVDASAELEIVNYAA